MEPEPRVICIGDIHGWLPRLTALWTALTVRVGLAELNETTVIFLGDYVDRGPNSAGVLDFLIALKASRGVGKTRFITGNHDFAMAAFLHSNDDHILPVSPESLLDLDLDETRNPAYSRGFWKGLVPGGMHYQGRRWGGSLIYNADTTFRSYGVEFGVDDEGVARDALRAAVPNSHRAFLRDLEWLAEVDLEDGTRVICVHAGLVAAEPLAPQLDALRRRDCVADTLQRGEYGRFQVLSGRGGVAAMHPELAGRGHTLLVSGHHSTRWSVDGYGGGRKAYLRSFAISTEVDAMHGERIILDVAGGKCGGLPLEAIILPSREVVGVTIADDATC